MTEREKALIPKEVITYHVTGFLTQRGGEKHPPKIVEERVNGNTVHIYTGYDKGSYLMLYPRRKIMPSTVPYAKKEVSIYDTKRDY